MRKLLIFTPTVLGPLFSLHRNIHCVKNIAPSTHFCVPLKASREPCNLRIEIAVFSAFWAGVGVWKGSEISSGQFSSGRAIITIQVERAETAVCRVPPLFPPRSCSTSSFAARPSSGLLLVFCVLSTPANAHGESINNTAAGSARG